MTSINIPSRGDLLAEIILYCATRPLKRPRLKGYAKGIYQPLDNQKVLREALKPYSELSIGQAVIMDSYCQLVKARTSKLKYPTGKSVHGDEDNLRKALSDALMHKKIFIDDSQILGGENYKFFGPEELTVIQLYAISTQTREIDYDL